jgi:periplasmic protein TonB
MLIVAVAIGFAVGWATLQRAPGIDANQAIERNLSAAQQALVDRRYIEPSHRSAVHYYSVVLELDPANAAAKAGIDRIADRLLNDAGILLRKGRLADAAADIAGVRRVRPHHPQLSRLESELQAEQERIVLLATQSASAKGAPPVASAPMPKQVAAAPTAATPPLDRAAAARAQRQSTAARALKLARTRMAEGQLIEPADDSAAFHVRAAQAADPTDRAVKEAIGELSTRLTTATRQAIDRGDVVSSRKLVAEARELQLPASQVDELVASIDAAAQDQAKGALLQLIQQRTAENRLTDPADSASEYLQQLKQADPSYPGLQRATDELGLRFVANALDAMEQRKLQLADELLGHARAIGFAGAELTAADTALRTARAPVATPAPVVPQPRKLIKYVAPDYPSQAHQTDVEGWVTLAVNIAPSGDVVGAQVVDGSKPRLFTQEALQAVRKWKYDPRPGAQGIDSTQVRVVFKFER